MVTAKHNNKVYGDLVHSPQFMLRFLTVPDTGAGPKCFMEEALPPAVQCKISCSVFPDFVDAKNNPLCTVEYMNLTVPIGCSLL